MLITMLHIIFIMGPELITKDIEMAFARDTQDSLKPCVKIICYVLFYCI